MNIVESDRQVGTASIVQESQTLHRVQFVTTPNWMDTKGARFFGVTCVNEKKTLMDLVSICEQLLNRNKIDLFLKWMLAGKADYLKQRQQKMVMVEGQ